MKTKEIYRLWKQSGTNLKFCDWLRASGHKYN